MVGAGSFCSAHEAGVTQPALTPLPSPARIPSPSPLQYAREPSANTLNPIIRCSVIPFRPMPVPCPSHAVFCRNNFMLFPGRDSPNKSLTYRTQNKRVKAAFLDVGIECTKVCHAFRHAIARHLDSLG